ncbi:proline-rich receptor-like protein kinase PERK2 [Camellia sinensis]|uniref:proline-rich receptor-like protein kinase PERK2 n=1 Tax=Camellia sinensis TaxID=4442 RepID=UPI0010368A13|nr:proline-rich receptor-like protein kinase PERK2 [Camellia sinensis]
MRLAPPPPPTTASNRRSSSRFRGSLTTPPPATPPPAVPPPAPLAAPPAQVPAPASRKQPTSPSPSPLAVSPPAPPTAAPAPTHGGATSPSPSTPETRERLVLREGREPYEKSYYELCEGVTTSFVKESDFEKSTWGLYIESNDDIKYTSPEHLETGAHKDLDWLSLSEESEPFEPSSELASSDCDLAWAMSRRAIWRSSSLNDLDLTLGLA